MPLEIERAFRLRPDDPADWDTLFERVSALIPAKPKRQRILLQNIIELLEGLGCSSAVIEFPYADQDFLYDYTHRHVQSFVDCGRECARIHFFRGAPLSEDNLLEDLRRYDGRERRQADLGEVPGNTGADVQAGTNAGDYLGFVVIRPTGDYCVGRTILRAPYDGEPTRHIHVRSRHRTFLYGVHLEVGGMPFMEQDRASHACGGAAAWGYCLYLHRRYGTRRLFPRQVTEIASELASYQSYAGGLSPPMIARVLSRLDCAIDYGGAQLPVPRDTDDTDKKASVLLERRMKLRAFVGAVCSYVASSIPVILGYWFNLDRVGHAVLAVGHSLEKEIVCPDKRIQEAAKEVGPLMDSDFCGHLYVHDDQRGPYRPLKIWHDSASEPIPDEKVACKKPIQCLEDACGVFFIAGVSKSTHVFHHAATNHVRKMLDPGDYPKEIQEDIADLWRDARWRFTLQDSRRFRAALLDQQRGFNGMDPVHVRAYRTASMPHYVYVCEFTAPYRVGNDRPRLDGELLLDPSRPAFFASDSRPVAFRVQDHLLVALDHEEMEYVAEDGFWQRDTPTAPMWGI